MTTLDDVFQPGGLLSQRFPGYAPREGQVKLARSYQEVFHETGVVIAEGPTGVGKSAAALIPALLDLHERGGKLVYVTASIVLQEQIVKKDLPSLADVLPFPFTYELLKGFGNYICKNAIEELENKRMMGAASIADDLALVEQILNFDWQKGDVSEFPVELPGRVRSLVTIQSDDCLRKRCLHYDACYPRAAKARAGQSQVIVTNYHLYAIHLSMVAQGMTGIFPDHRLLVLDEFHQAPDIFRTFFGTRVSPFGAKAISAELDAQGQRAEKLGLPPEIDPQLKRNIHRAAEAFGDSLERVRKDKGYSARLKRAGQLPDQELEGLLRTAAQRYQVAASQNINSDAADFLRKRALKSLEYASLIRRARELGEDSVGWIFYVEESGKSRALVGEPVSVAEMLGEKLFAKTAPGPKAIVCCSATLATGSGDSAFDYAAQRSGLDRPGVECSEVLVESPFDFSRTALVVPKGLPDPGDRFRKSEYQDAVANSLIELVGACEGRVLGLFTSYDNLEVATRRLRGVGLGYPVYRQGELPRGELIRRFKEERHSVLLGTSSLWEGIDIQGDSCVAVMIDKIPFEHMDDPVLDAIKAEDPEWFKNYYLPKAVVDFKQGFGRLIRTTSDYGVVVCCDRRLTTKGYGKSFLKALPKGVGISDSLEDVPGLLERFERGEAHGLRRAA